MAGCPKRVQPNGNALGPLEDMAVFPTPQILVGPAVDRLGQELDRPIAVQKVGPAWMARAEAPRVIPIRLGGARRVRNSLAILAGGHLIDPRQRRCMGVVRAVG